MSSIFRSIVIVTVVLPIFIRTAQGGESVSESRHQMTKTVSGHQLPYLLQTPTGEPPKDGWPLLLFLHGYGECGTDLEKVKVHGPPKLTDRFEQLSNCIIVSPQCPTDSWWRVDALRALVDEVLCSRDHIDRDRLYVTGLSMGGYGIWTFLSHDPHTFVAAVPICGGGDPLRLPKNQPPEKIGVKNEFKPEGLAGARHVPIWTFHGTEDGAVPIAESELIVRMLRDAGNTSLQFTIYERAGHVAAWEKAYENPEMWDWLFSQRRDSQRGACE